MTNDTTQRLSGFYLVDNNVIDDYGPLIGAYGIAVYSVLARYADGAGMGSFPSFQTIADHLDLSRRTVMRTVAKLCAAGLITKRSRKSSSGAHSSNDYRLIGRCGSGSSPGDSPTLPSDSQTLPSDSQTLPLVTHRHHPSVCESPDQDTVDQYPLDQYPLIHHHHSDSHSNGDDDDFDYGKVNRGPSENFPSTAVGTKNLSPPANEKLFEYAVRLAQEKLPEWNGPRNFLASLAPDQFLAALSWLYLYSELNKRSTLPVYDAVNVYAQPDPFRDVESIPGKIIAQSRLGNLAPLVGGLRDLLVDELSELTEADLPELQYLSMLGVHE
ncbi:hypothetical protein LCGC14_0759850 [marine sediment metagenome]|uniref:Helix-turn-helix domain-containing protein n=1 Tax=marine sediment metagenome TaxID=412755 RepID=A0A0F9Q1K9_9ZZZZ